ncbi:hypothetical protein [Pontibacter mangrovi]|uniref:Uncharacterized protein n=1 Tax=Pontibacter mangrovi TaxID=2589816 RepID=A0A501W871_9BACT|nr:hypothetical protein [Pontibacter mangrovi]TPE44922.1 hypothetical protein FJM65_07870 [Pontibacter mangrovi]
MMKKLYKWLMANKWRKWGTVALLSIALNYTLLILEVIDADQFQTITQVILSIVKFFTLGT